MQSQDERIVRLLQPRDCGKEADDYDDDRRKPQHAPADLSERVGCHESVPLQKEWLRGGRTGPKRMEQALGWLHCKLPKMNRSEEHTSELQSLMRISYAVFCLKKKQTKRIQN